MARHTSAIAFATAALLAALIPVSAADAPNTLTAAEKAAGWRLLFDGSSTKGWRGYKKPDMSGLRWIVKDGAICLPPADGSDTLGHRDIISADKYADFELTWQWQVQPGSNSGVKYFVLEEGNAAIGHEYQIIDDARHADAKVSTERQTASFYDVKSATARPTKPIGEWNTSRVLVSGTHVEHWLNDTKVLEYELGSPEILAAVQDSKFSKTPGFGTKKSGHILLQDHGDAVCYRGVKIKPSTT
jgi:hypothetical protein